MIQYLNKLEEERRLLLERTKDLTVDQYNIVPPSFNNNIIWNMGHILVVSESLLYQNSSYQRPVYQFMKSSFKKGSIPDGMVDEDDIFIIRHSLQQTAQFTLIQYFTSECPWNMQGKKNGTKDDFSFFVPISSVSGSLLEPLKELLQVISIIINRKNKQMTNANLKSDPQNSLTKTTDDLSGSLLEPTNKSISKRASSRKRLR